MDAAAAIPATPVASPAASSSFWTFSSTSSASWSSASLASSPASVSGVPRSLRSSTNVCVASRNSSTASLRPSGVGVPDVSDSAVALIDSLQVETASQTPFAQSAVEEPPSPPRRRRRSPRRRARPPGPRARASRAGRACGRSYGLRRTAASPGRDEALPADRVIRIARCDGRRSRRKELTPARQEGAADDADERRPALHARGAPNPEGRAAGGRDCRPTSPTRSSTTSSCSTATPA